MRFHCVFRLQIRIPRRLARKQFPCRQFNARATRTTRTLARRRFPSQSSARSVRQQFLRRGKCAVCQSQGKDNCGSFCTTCDSFGICDWREGAGKYSPGFDINAVLGADHRTPSYKMGRCAVCNGVGRLCPTCRNIRLPFVAPTPYGIQKISCDCRYAVPCSNCAGSGQRLVQDMGVKKGDSQSAPPVDDEPVIVDVSPPVRTQPFPQSPLDPYDPDLAPPVNTTSFS